MHGKVFPSNGNAGESVLKKANYLGRVLIIGLEVQLGQHKADLVLAARCGNSPFCFFNVPAVVLHSERGEECEVAKVVQIVFFFVPLPARPSY